MRRRTLLAGVMLALTACGGGSEIASPFPAQPLPAVPPTGQPTGQPEWVVRIPSFVAGTGASFDLATTLPQGVARNGTFAVHANGARLPAGMTLSPQGILSVGNATVGEVSGVVFSYSEP